MSSEPADATTRRRPRISLRYRLAAVGRFVSRPSFLAPLLGFGSVFVAPAVYELIRRRLDPLGTLLVMGFAALLIATAVALQLPRLLGQRLARRPTDLSVSSSDPRAVAGVRDLNDRRIQGQGVPPLVLSTLQRSSARRLVLIASAESSAEVGECREALALWHQTSMLTVLPELTMVQVAGGELDPAPVADALSEILVDCPARDIVVDGTGGTGLMSVSAYAAALEAGVDFQMARQDRVGHVTLLRQR